MTYRQSSLNHINIFIVSLYRFVACLSLFVCLYHTGTAQKKSGNNIYLNGTTISAEANTGAWFPEFASKKDVQVQAIIVRFDKLPDERDKATLKRNGLELQDYLPDNAFTALIYPTANIKALIEFGPQFIVYIKPEWKIEPALYTLLKGPGRELNVLISLAKTSDNAEQLITNVGGSIVRRYPGNIRIYEISVSSAKIKTLAALAEVSYISLARTPVPLDMETINTQRANTAILPAAYGGYGLTGEGITIGVGDNTSGNFHIDLKDRITNYNPMKYENHGIHTTGIAAGAGIADPRARGLAPSAGIVSQYYSAIWEETPAYFQAHNMTITNNSYAAALGDCRIAGLYENNSVAIDRYANDYPEVLHVFAGGNDGVVTCAPFPEGYGTVSGAYQPAKNNLVVSSIDRFYQNRDVTSSSGPVKDGRLKPEISAVGAQVYSADKADEYFTTLGTSQAAPQVVGALALLSERYKQLNGPDNPRGDLMKAIILTGATDVGNPGPDFTNGFGTLNLRRSLLILDSNRYAANTISQGATQTQTINVPNGMAQLKVLLTWQDAPASPMAGKMLVDDLDLEVAEPAGTIRYPLVLDPAPANVKNLPVEKQDRLNNTEEVVIDNPAPGTYTIRINGYNIPSTSRSYVVAYDIIPTGVVLTYPTAGAQMNALDSAFIYWEASRGTEPFTLEYSTDNGTIWNVIDNNIPADQLWYVWKIPQGISSGQCRMRITRNGTGQTSASGMFAVTPQQMLTLDTVQCPGYIRMNWTEVAGASGYEVLIKRGPDMKPVDTVTGNSYTFSALAFDSFYYAAVRPFVNGLPGYRSIAVKRKPDNGNCAGNISDGDLAMLAWVGPQTGRKLTSSALTENENLVVRVRNLDDAACDSYKISYTINGSPWKSKTVIPGLAAGASADVVVDNNLDFTFFGTYDISVAVENLTAADAVTANDTLRYRIRSLNNDLIGLTPFTDDFEDMPAFSLHADSLGISPNHRWDFTNGNDTGRLRSYANPGITIQGNRSVSLDAVQNTPMGVRNELIGTFNLQNISTQSMEMRFEFDYILHGVPKNADGNGVWLRGNDTAAWLNVYNYNKEVSEIGKIQNSGSLSLSKLLSDNGQRFSSSTQIKFAQHDTSVISLKNYGNGLTMDNVKIYTVYNDVQMVAVESPKNVECGLMGEIPIRVRIKNGVNYRVNNIVISYNVDGGPTHSDVISSLQARTELIHTFSQKADFTKLGLRKINVWVNAVGDTYRKNDSLLNYEVHNEPLIENFPYKEDFEKGDGYWYTGGLASSWEYGTPAGEYIAAAASGTKAWVTDLDGNYNPLEQSYLYSPCFDFATMRQPVLKFARNIDIEDCGTIRCDGAYVEYTEDGTEWKKLGKSGEGINWYTDTIFDIWTGEAGGIWQTSAIKTPTGMSSVRFRFVFSSDIGVNLEGMGIDDVEIYDYYRQDNVTAVFPNPATGAFTIRWTATEGSVMQLRLTDITGREVYTGQATAADAQHTDTRIVPPKLSPGVYLLKCKVGDIYTSEHKLVFL